MVAPHRLHEGPLFDDAAIIGLLDTMDRQMLQVNTMGEDPTADLGSWVDGRADHVGGRELLDAVYAGRLWLQVLELQSTYPQVRALVERAYADLATVVVDFPPLRLDMSLIVSSPTAHVYYHLDPQPNLLWHLRGTKSVWVYPAHDQRFVSTRDLQRVMSGETHEEVPFDPSWDAHAERLDLQPGQVASWPQNAPHRVVNTGGLNVSLSSEHETCRTLRLQQVISANRYFSAKFGLSLGSMAVEGVGAALKVNAFRALRRFRPLPPAQRTPAFEIGVDGQRPLTDGRSAPPGAP